MDTSLLVVADVSRDIREYLAAAANQPIQVEAMPENDWFAQFEQDAYGGGHEL